MVIISLELTRVNPDRNIFLINVKLTSTFGPSHSPNFKKDNLRYMPSIINGTQRRAITQHFSNLLCEYYSLAGYVYSR